MMQMNYAQAVEYMQDLAMESGKESGTLWIDIEERAALPKVIPIAVSKGKSSILTYLDAIYAYMRVRVCICHLRFLQNVEDCIRINGRNMPKSKLAEYVSRLQEQTMDAPCSFADAIQRIAYWYACEKGCSLLFVESDTKQEGIELSQITNIKSGVRKQSFSYRGYQKLEITMKGAFQIENAAKAVEVIESLAENPEFAGKSPAARESAIRKGLVDAVWQGSLYQAGTKPLCIQDMADDARSVEKLLDYLEEHRAQKPWIFLLAMAKQADWMPLCERLCKSAVMTITVTPPHMNRRTVYSAYELAQELSAYTSQITAADSMEEALELGRMLAGEECILLCFGAHTIAGEVSRILASKEHKISDVHGISLDTHGVSLME